MRFERAAELDTTSPNPSSVSRDGLPTRGSESPLAAGHTWLLLARKASDAALLDAAQRMEVLIQEARSSKDVPAGTSGGGFEATIQP